MDYKNILFLCTGNLCRSPLAEAILKDLVRDEDITVHSAGTHAIDGLSVAEHGIVVAKENGLDISLHKTRMITKEMLQESDLVLAMSPVHLDFIRIFFPKYYDKVYLLKKFGREKEHLIEDSIHDPIGGDEEEYHECFALLKAEIERVASMIFENRQDVGKEENDGDEGPEN